MKPQIQITITVQYNCSGYKNAYNEHGYHRHHARKGLAPLTQELQQRIDRCTSLIQLHELFFSIERKSRRLMKALIRKRKALEFDRLVSRNPISSPQNHTNNGSNPATAAAAGSADYFIPGSSR